MSSADIFRPLYRAEFRADKMGKNTLFQSPRVLIGLNTFEPGQEHALHSHDDLDKAYHVLAGEGEFLTDDGAEPMEPDMMMIAPSGVAHGIRNTGKERLVVLAVLAGTLDEK